ncbi:sodium/solute symporter [Cyclobacterium sp.]|uniref:sodium:solute symporter family transporter n=1 Tax=Cyclobacterium sp. TaxID=1966343 RepID=UPI0019A20643|nr:sodium/solute symporter [Cyclobacterium sp.]MBD3627822.1 sodium/solute symporter [Cyclobacterium sp.]
MVKAFKITFFGLVLLPFLLNSSLAQEKPKTYGDYEWQQLATLPAPDGEGSSLGYAGMYAGTHNGALILAGGANFPGEKPWKGGKKKFWNKIHVLIKDQSEAKWVEGIELSLPESMAYGASVSTPGGVFCLGGENEDGYHSSTWWISWNESRQEVTVNEGLPLPMALSNASAVYHEGFVYLVGGENEQVWNKFYRLNINESGAKWESLPPLPGPERSHAMMAIQHEGKEQRIYLAGGRRKEAGAPTVFFGDLFSFSFNNMRWESHGSIEDGEGNIISLAAGTAAPFGSGHILLFGGDEGKLYHQLEQIAMSLAEPSLNSSDSLELVNERENLLASHPGFSRRVLAYHAVTKTWSRLADLPFKAPVTTSSVFWEGTLVLPSGEISPGVRTPGIQGMLLSKKEGFGWLNYSVLGLYLGVLVVMGFVISKKQASVTDFFKAGGRVPWWAAGISVFGTQLSAITFMAIPSKTFATDWTLFWLLMTIIMVSPIIIFWFLPFFRRLNLTSAYEYLEMRFDKTVRLLGSLIYMALQLGRLGIVLLLPSLALAVITDIDVMTCILLMGVLSILYTVLGGIEAVIWTDVIQVVVLLGGALICLVLMVFSIDLSWGELAAFIKEDQKMTLFDTRFDFTGTAIWVILLGGLASNIVQYGSDQTVIQRYLTTKDEASASKSIVTGALMALPSALIFFSIGTALYLFYLTHPQELSPVMTNTDSIFPWYIVTQLPNGVSGLLIAAVFAAAMSSLDSSMNSVATVVTTDFYHKFFSKDSNGKHTLTFARTVTVFVGVLGTGFALLMATMGIPSLWDQFNMLIGLFAGGLGGIFLIGILSSSTNARGALIGLLGSALIQVLVKTQTALSIHLYAFTGLVSAMLLAYLASKWFPRPSKEKLTGLTLKTMGKRIKRELV